MHLGTLQIASCFSLFSFDRLYSLTWKVKDIDKEDHLRQIMCNAGPWFVQTHHNSLWTKNPNKPIDFYGSNTDLRQ